MDYVYPALFHKNNNGSYTVFFPDLPGCITEGKSKSEALSMAQDALTQWIGFLIDEKMVLPPASEPETIITNEGEFISLVLAEIKDSKAVRRTVSIPKWMDDKAMDVGLSLSKVLQEALSSRLA